MARDLRGKSNEIAKSTLRGDYYCNKHKGIEKCAKENRKSFEQSPIEFPGLGRQAKQQWVPASNVKLTCPT